MELEQAKKVRDVAEMDRVVTKQMLDAADARLEKAITAVQDVCPHNDVTGRLIKWCRDCGHVETFWSFPKLGGKKNAR